MITGAPGSGKSSVVQAFTTLLDNAGVEHGAFESEQLAWGSPWLDDAHLVVPGDVAAARVLAREPERWAGRDALAAHARSLAPVIPALPGVDLVLGTEGRDEESVAAELLDAAQARGLLALDS